jgi:CheY-like chemotaxis protein
MRILIAEDELVSQRMLEKLLQRYGQVDCVSDGEAALVALTRAHEAGTPYKLVCLDFAMPHRNGIEVLRGLRELEQRLKVEDKSQACALMITGIDDKENFLQSVAEGSQWYVTKPVKKEALDAVLEDLGFVRNQ